MKKIIYIFLTALTIACANSSAPTTENARADEEAIDTAIAIDSVIVAEVVFEDICFLIHRSTYPKISGLADQRFEKKLNEMLRNNFNTFISLAKKEFGGCPDDDDDDYLDVGCSVLPEISPMDLCRSNSGFVAAGSLSPLGDKGARASGRQNLSWFSIKFVG